MKPTEIADALNLLIEIQQPVFITGEAGAGKSQVVKQVTTKRGLNLIDVRAVLLDPVDLRGLPHVNGDGRAHWAIPEFLPRDGEGVLFFDELNRAPMLVQNACLQLALDRKVGEYELPPGWTVVAAGNPDTHRGVTRMSEALANRFVHLDFDVDLDDWCKHAASVGIAPEVIAFLRFRPNLLHSYDRASTEKAYPSPRSWEFTSKILNASPAAHIEHALYSGTVGSGPAAEFTGFLSIYRNLPAIDAILREPQSAMVPTDPGPLFAISAALARRSTVANFAKVMEYCDRMPREYAVYAIKDATARDAALCDTVTFVKFATENADIMG